MAKSGRGQTRRDSKRRILRPGESVRADGKYQYKYQLLMMETTKKLDSHPVAIPFSSK